MKTPTLKICFIILFSFAFFSCSPDEDGIYFDDTSTNALKTSKTEYSVIEAEILSLVNTHRESLGLSELTPLSIVSNVADTHTNYMIETGKVSHDNFSERSQNLIENAKAKSVGENVAYGFSSAKGVVNGWLNSDGHRKIIENPNYTHFGISTESNNNGRNYFTHIFIDK